VKDLTSPERQLWAAFRTGERVHLGGGDPEHGAKWGGERLIRAEVVCALLTGVVGPAAEGVAGVRVAGARIVGRFDLRFATVLHPLSLRSCYIDTKLDMHGVRCREIDLTGSYVRGGIRISTGDIDGHLLLNDTVVEKSVRLIATHVAGALFMNGACLSGGPVRPNGPAFEADKLRVDVDMLCGHGFSAHGEMRFAGAHIGDTLDLDQASLTNPDGCALQAARITVGGDLLCRDGFTAKGEVNLDGASVAGQFAMDGARLVNPRRYALRAARLAVRGEMRCATGFVAEGEIHLLDARFSGPFVLDGAHVHNAGGLALHASGLTATAMFCRTGFAAEGEIRLSGASIDGPLDFSGAQLARTASRSLGCWWLTARELILRFAAPVDGTVDLRFAQLGLLQHSPDAPAARLRIDGLTYSSIAPSDDIEVSLAWLRRAGGGFRPQPYEQLAAVCRRRGNDHDARKVLLIKERHRHRGSPPLAKAWGYLQDATVGYGYRPWRAAGWLVALLVAGTVLFSVRHPAPIDPRHAPRFHALVYTLDLLVPVIDFGQKKAYLSPAGWQQWLTYALIAVGWVLATTIAAGITRALRRQ
jgi:hypothetical protein